MIIKKFKVKNYKSIVDSGDCYLEDDLIIFAGKNESGKSSLLEALEDFNIDSKIKKASLPIGDEEKDLEISVTFLMLPQEIKFFSEDKKFLEKSLEIEIKKDYYDKYSISDETDKLLSINKKSLSSLKDAYERKTQIHYQIYEDNISNYSLANAASFEIDFENISETIVNIENYLNKFKVYYTINSSTETKENDFYENVQIMKELLEEYTIHRDELSKKWNKLLQLIPNFVLFRSFEDNLPNKIPINEIETNKFTLDLASVSEFDPGLILAKDPRKTYKHKDSLNLNLNSDYARYWTQDVTQLKIEWDSDDLSFWVIEEDEWYEPNQRSKDNGIYHSTCEFLQELLMVSQMLY